MSSALHQVEQDPQFTEFLSTLPKHCVGSFDVYEYQGFWYPSFILKGVVFAQQQFQALPTDIFICGCPKTGNTWLKSLCFAITTRKQYPQNADQHHPLETNLSHSLMPVLELATHENPIIRNDYVTQQLIGSHLPYVALPESITKSPGCKIIYISREPKDTFVSMFHFSLNFLSDFKLTRQLDLFCEGKTAYGSYWDHVLGYHKASLERPDKFLLLKYEQLKTDTVLHVKKLAAFMDQPFSIDEELEGVPEKIVEMCSFRNLSGLESNKTGILDLGIPIPKRAYFRKGETGDWKNELNEEMAEKFDKITEEKLKGSGFSFA